MTKLVVIFRRNFSIRCLDLFALFLDKNLQKMPKILPLWNLESSYEVTMFCVVAAPSFHSAISQNRKNLSWYDLFYDNIAEKWLREYWESIVTLLAAAFQCRRSGWPMGGRIGGRRPPGHSISIINQSKKQKSTKINALDRPKFTKNLAFETFWNLWEIIIYNLHDAECR